MKKILSLFGAFMLGAITPVFAATLHVPGDYATIQAAINAASAGDEIVVADGSYNENLAIDKFLTLRGNTQAGVVITPASPGYGITVTADNVTLERFTLQNAQHYGIKVAKTSGYLTNFNVNNITVQNSARTNLDLNGVSSSSITNSTFASAVAGAGIALTNSKDTTLSNNITQSNLRGGTAIYTRTNAGYPTSAGSENIVVANNTHNETVGLYTQQTNGTLSAPDAAQYVCSVTSDDTSVRPDIAEFIYYFKTKTQADAYAALINGETVCSDTTKPTATFVKPVLDQVFTGGSVDVQLDAADDTAIASIVINIKNPSGGNIGTCYNNPNVGTGSFTANCVVNISSYADGRYELRAGILDVAGNRLTTSTYFIVDRTNPVVDIVFPPHGAAMKGTFTATGSAGDETSGVKEVRYTIQHITAIDGTVIAEVTTGVANGTGMWDFAVSGLTDGFYRLIAQAVDHANNTVTDTHDILVDNTKPVTTVISPAPDGTFDADFTVNINSTDSGSDIVKVVANLYGPSGLIAPCTNQTIDPAQESVDFTCDVDVDALADGNYYIKTNARDAAGNISNTVTWNFTVGETEEPCEPSTEVCDEVDNDCDEMIDEDGVCDDDEEVCTDDVVTTDSFSVPATTSTASPLTTISFVSGDLVQLTAAGTWAAGNDDPCTRTSDANGIDADHECYATYGLNGSFPYGALIGSINGGEWFLIGTSFSFTASEDGTLVVAYSDSGYEDNTGSIDLSTTKTTTVEVECPAVCGNGVLDEGETCDDGNMINEDGCNSSCQIEGSEEPVCGNGIVEEGEECDAGGSDKKMLISEGYCNEVCEWVDDSEPEAICGDEMLDEGEACDDGNMINGDGCNNSCQIENGGGQASSIGNGNNTPTPPTLLETGPEDEQEPTPTEETPSIEEQVNDLVATACNEDTYILNRYAKLIIQPTEIVYNVPAVFEAEYGKQIAEAKNKFMSDIEKQMSTEERNDYIRKLVCDVETLKAERGLRHAHIGYKPSGETNIADYILQYIQDIAILRFVK